MIQSMTGYGASTRSSANFKIAVELKSLNSKYVEINMKLPRTYMQQELEIRNLLTGILKRGKVNAVLNVEVLNPEKHRLRINRPLVRAYTEELDALRRELDMETGPDLEFILGLPDAISTEEEESDPEEWALISEAFEEAAKKLYDSRTKEGAALEADMRASCKVIAEQLKEVRRRLPERLENIRRRLEASLQEVKDRAQLDGNRYEQELIYYIEKLDINEEMVRLEKHLEYFEHSMSEDMGSGKKLGFISQEMGREINTIGSKANDADIQTFVVRMKEELEKIKEQVLNVV